MAPLAHAGWLALSAERDLHLALRHAYWREGYALGREHGWKQGYDAACADQKAAYHAMAWRVAHGDPRSHAELERERWGPGGRENFGDPRPGDRRPGKEAAP
jgi:hypothetical protein